MRRDVRRIICTVMLRGLCLAMAVAPVTAQAGDKLDRMVLPIAPNYTHSTVLDAHKATPPPRFEVKAPATLRTC